MALDHKDTQHHVQCTGRIHTDTSALATRAAGNTLKSRAFQRVMGSAPEAVKGASAVGGADGALDGALIYSPAKYTHFQDTPALS